MADKTVEVGESQVIEEGATSSSAETTVTVELASISVKGLFGRYDHTIDFPHAGIYLESDPALVIIHGQNGVGKTTLLLMLDGLMRLDFDVFRVRPFRECRLKFSSGKVLAARSLGIGQPLQVTFAKHRTSSGPGSERLILLINPRWSNCAKRSRPRPQVYVSS